MDNKKKIIITSLIVSIVVLIVAGFSYAFIVAMTNEGDVGTGSGLLDINYIAPDTTVFDNSIIVPSSNRNFGLNTSASASLKDGSLNTLFNMYINPKSLTNLDIPALKWEVEGVMNGQIVYTNSGNFDKKVVDTKFAIVDGYNLSTDITTFNIYIWLDESLVTSQIESASFSIGISADTIQLTGDL